MHYTTQAEEIKRWADKFKEIRKNERDVKIGIVASNNHYGGYGPRTLSIIS
jgi:hypothetical protein